MKIEIIKQTDWDGIWYFVKVDNWTKHCHRDLKDAETNYERILEDAKKPAVTELIKSIEI
jgi:preprotein translocase subunit Sss1